MAKRSTRQPRLGNFAHAMHMMSLESWLKEQARDLGFDLVGIAPATDADGFQRLQDWLAHGHHGFMAYMQAHEQARRHPSAVLAGVRSVVMLGLNYFPGRDDAHVPSAKIARYARGDDYHDVLRDKLTKLLECLQQRRPGVQGRAVVDTAPLLERDFARRAGLGWFGKNTMLIHKKLGSYFFLGALLLDCDLLSDAPFETNHCGSCTACLDACPTGAFPEPGWLDARRCISYLTIELRGRIPNDLRAPMGDWLFGCDICQEVCPWNRKSPLSLENAWKPRSDLAALDPAELLTLSEHEFRLRFRNTALWRSKRSGLLRNAAIVLGNTGTAAHFPVLTQAAADSDPVIADAARWAIDRIRTRVSADSPPAAS